MKYFLMLTVLLFGTDVFANENFFTSPGIARMEGGSWVGSEDLYNLNSDIGTIVEVIKPEMPVALNYSENITQNKVVTILRAAGLAPQMSPFSGLETPLPLLHILLMINPIERGYVVFCALRLFEVAKIARVHLEEGVVWQVVTWEKQELLLTPANQLQEQVDNAFQSMANSFAAAYHQQPKEKTRLNFQNLQKMAQPSKAVQPTPTPNLTPSKPSSSPTTSPGMPSTGQPVPSTLH